MPLLAIATVLLPSMAGEAAAQVADNFQQRVETFAPPFIAQPRVELHTERKETRDYSLEGRLEALLKLNPDEQEAILGDATKALLSDRKRNLLLNERIQKDLDPATHNTAQRARTLLGLSPSRKRLLLSLPPYNIQYSNILKGQTPTGSLTFAVNPTDETNVLKSNVNPKPDKSFALGGTFQYTQQGLPDRTLDVMGFSVGANSARYRDFPSKSQDLFNLAIAYQFFLDAFSGTHKIETGKPLPDHVTAGLITADTLLVGFQNTLAATPTFHAYSVDLFTPQAVLTRQNINLSDKVYCYNRADTASRKDPRFCTSADLSVAIGQTFSDLGTQQNANLAVAGTLYQRINETDFTVGLQVIATGKTYETYRGGRRDIVFQEGPLIRFTPTPDPRSKLSVSMALAVNFFQQHSTVAANSWRGIVVQPSVTVRF